eukprot:6184474-Pleurochrysis_carterae.AAC.1
MGGTIVDEPCPTVVCHAVHPPCDISSSFMPQPPNSYYDYIGGPFNNLRYGYFVYGQSCRAYYWGEGIVRVMGLYVWGSLTPSAPLRACYHI